MLVGAAQHFIDGIPLFRVRGIKIGKILFLLEQDAALQRKGKLANARDINLFGIFQREPQIGNLVHIATRLCAAYRSDLLVELAHGQVHRELTRGIQEFLGETAFAHIGNEQGLSPLNGHTAPADGHGVNLAVFLGGEQDGIVDLLHDFASMFNYIDRALHTNLLYACFRDRLYRRGHRG